MKLIRSLLLLVTISTSVTANETEQAEPWLERLAQQIGRAHV